MPKLNINEIDLKNKLVIVRCDFNIPLENGVITDDYQLINCKPKDNLLLAKENGTGSSSIPPRPA